MLSKGVMRGRILLKDAGPVRPCRGKLDFHDLTDAPKETTPRSHVPQHRMRTHCDVGGGSLRKPKSSSPMFPVAHRPGSSPESTRGSKVLGRVKPARRSVLLDTPPGSRSLCSQKRPRAASLEADNMRRFLALLLGLALGAAVVCPGFALAQTTSPDEVVKKPLNAPRYRSGFSTAAAQTVW